MADLKKASEWCLEHSDLLLGSVQLPKVLCMEEQDVSEAMETLQNAEFSEDRIAALEPYSFVFTEIEDMTVFLNNVVDIMNLKVFCEVEMKENA